MNKDILKVFDQETGKITIDEAIRILDPETRKEALRPYDYNYNQMKQVFDKACQVVIAELCGRQWASVDIELPAKGLENLLVVVNGQYGAITFINAIQFATYDHETGEWILDEFPEWEFPDITYWMPLPNLPEIKGSEK